MIDVRQALPPTRGWAASPDLLVGCVGLVLQLQPRLIIECGSGVSTAILAYALERAGQGQLISLEHDKELGDQTRELLRRHGLSNRAAVVLAPLDPYGIDGDEVPWYRLTSIPEFDRCQMLIVDGPPTKLHALTRYPALPVFFDRMSEGCVVVLDDGRRQEERAIADRWSHEFGLICEFVEHEKGTYLFSKLRSDI